MCSSDLGDAPQRFGPGGGMGPGGPPPAAPAAQGTPPAAGAGAGAGAPPQPNPQQQVMAEMGRRFGALAGPALDPGVYLVKLIVDGKELTTKVVVEADNR